MSNQCIIEVTANDSVAYGFGHADWQGTGTAVEHASPEAWHSWFKSRFAHTRAHQDHLWKRLGDHVNSGLHPFTSPDAYFRGLADLMAEGRIKVYALPPIKVPSQAAPAEPADENIRAQGPATAAVATDTGGASAAKGVATEDTGADASEQQCLGDPVAPATGEEILTLDDFTVGAGMPLRWQRWYRSRFSDRNLGLGYGWFADCLRLIWQDEEATWLVDHEARAVKLPLLAPGEMAWHATGGQRLEHKTDSRMLLTEQDGRAWVFARDTQGQWRPTSVQNTLGQQWLFHYDAQQRLSRLDLSPSRRLLFGYGQGPNLQVVMLEQGDEQQPLATYQYDSLGNLIQAKTPSGTERYGYDGHLLTQRTLATGYTFIFQWQGIGPDARCLRTCGEDGHHDYRFDYQPDQRLTRVTDAFGQQQVYHYDDQQRITARQDPDGGVHQWAYHPNGQLAAYRLPDGRTTEYHYDHRGRCVLERLPDGREHRRRYNALGFCTDERQPNGQRHQRRIDPLGRLLSEVRPDGSQWRYHYDHQGWLQSITSDTGQTLRLGYNPDGDLLAQEHQGHLQRYAYDSQGRIQGLLSQDLVTAYEYQGQQLTAVHQYPEQAPQQKRSRQYGYDEAGRLNRFTTATGDTHGYQYDRLNRPVSYQRPDGHQVRYDYDKAERLTAVIRPDGSRWQLAYDSQGKVSHCDAPDGRRIELRYDAAGQVIHREQTGDWVQRLTRDAGGRVLQQLSQGRDRSPVSKQFQYDAYGRRSHASCAERQLAWTYDAYGNVSEHRQDQHRIGYEYGKGRRLQRMTLPDGTHVHYQYDDQGRWIGLQLNGTDILNRTLDDQGRELSRDAGHNRQTQVWDRHQCLISRRWQGAGTGETGLRRYTWDAESRLEAVSDSVTGDTTYRRDPQGQLIGENDTAYQYDLGGNRITEHSQLQQDRLLDTGDSHRQYDALGAETRVQQDSTEHRQFDAEGNLLSVRREGLYVQYGYDALGRRAWRKTEDGTTTYLWHQDVLLGEQNPQGQWQWYLRDPNTDEPLLTLIDGQPYYYELDHRMLPVRLWHQDGYTVWQANADAWGHCHPDTPHGPIHQPIRLPGQFEDNLTGLYNNRFRDYDPRTGRYLTPDPIGLKGGLNSYRYTKNPVDYIDPLGLESKKVIASQLEELDAAALDDETLPNLTEVPVIGENGRIVGMLSVNTMLVRFEPNDVPTPMQPHQSTKYFDVSKAMEYGLKPDFYDALFVVSSDNEEALRLQRDKQGYFDSEGEVVKREKLLSDVFKEHPDAKVLSDYRFNGTVLGNDGGYIIVSGGTKKG
ncbi:MAG: DUF6531 domain-containing protein [Marinobacter sp.]|nr:DUF6531 domain-containing protein [Marinobacter sp.]